VVAANVTASTAPTNDTARSVTLAQAERAEARDASAQASRSIAEKAVSALGRRRAADQPAHLTQPGAPVVGGAAGAAAPTAPPRLVQEETMVEGGRDVRRRIYRVEEVLVTLDERLPSPSPQSMRAEAANTPRADSTRAIPVQAIRWTDARGAEFTLTGPVPPERLERIRKLLGY
jgi:hypothetical protein